MVTDFSKMGQWSAKVLFRATAVNGGHSESKLTYKENVVVGNCYYDPYVSPNFATDEVVLVKKSSIFAVHIFSKRL